MYLYMHTYLIHMQRITHTFCFYRGQNPLHILGQYGRENAAAIFELFLECMPEYPIDKVDADGNTGTITKHITLATTEIPQPVI